MLKRRNCLRHRPQGLEERQICCCKAAHFFDPGKDGFCREHKLRRNSWISDFTGMPLYSDVS